MAAGALVVDIRPSENRTVEGPLPGAVVVERIHLEWRLDPTSPDRLPEVRPGQHVILVCNEGYSSSLAAADLLDLGIEQATDLIGGYRAWAGHQTHGPRSSVDRDEGGRVPLADERHCGGPSG